MCWRFSITKCMWHLGTISLSLSFFFRLPRSFTICILVCLIIWGARFGRTHIYRRSSRLLIIKLQFSPILTLKELSLLFLFAMSEFYRFWCVWSNGIRRAEYSLLCLLQVSIKSAEYLNALRFDLDSFISQRPYGVSILSADCRFLSEIKIETSIWNIYCNICTGLSTSWLNPNKYSNKVGINVAPGGSTAVLLLSCWKRE